MSNLKETLTKINVCIQCGGLRTIALLTRMDRSLELTACRFAFSVAILPFLTPISRYGSLRLKSWLGSRMNLL